MSRISPAVIVLSLLVVVAVFVLHRFDVDLPSAEEEQAAIARASRREVAARSRQRLKLPARPRPETADVEGKRALPEVDQEDELRAEEEPREEIEQATEEPTTPFDRTAKDAQSPQKRIPWGLLIVLMALPLLWLFVMHYSLSNLLSDYLIQNQTVSGPVAEEFNTLKTEIDQIRLDVNRIGQDRN